MSSHPIHGNKIINMSDAYLLAAMTFLTVALMTTGCSTTHEFKPTASVMVGAHKSL